MEDAIVRALLLLGSMTSAVGAYVYARIEWRRAHVDDPAGRLAKATEDLQVAALKVDSLVDQVNGAAAARADEVARLEKLVAELEGRQAELNAQVTSMENVPPEAIRQFGSILAAQDRQRLRRDVAFLVAGALLAAALDTAITFLLS